MKSKQIHVYVIYSMKRELYYTGQRNTSPDFLDVLMRAKIYYNKHSAGCALAALRGSKHGHEYQFVEKRVPLSEIK